MNAAPSPVPLYLGNEGEGLFAWLHRPAIAGQSSHGLIICNPFGFEEVCTHQSLLHLAAAVADSGVPVLRFDYPGCGNSAGDEYQPQLMARWLSAVHQAADALKQATGVPQVCLLGVRMGALLATQAAMARSDVAGLIAIAPVVRGRAYLRELTMLGESGAPPSEGGGRTDGLLESAGFLLTRETADTLAAIDLRQIERPPAPHVLLVDRDDMPSAASWASELERVGTKVQLAAWRGYAGMVRDPQRAQPPADIIAGVVATLKAWQPAEPLPWREPSAVGTPSQRLQGPGATFTEAAVHVDTGASRLFGVLTQAVGAGPQPAVLMLNSGSVHHIGPNRLWVRLAREWAQRGVTVLRLDISGIGDSPARPGVPENVVYTPHAGADIAAALAYLRREVGATECHTLGLCSGGYHALKAAMNGQYMASALMVNPLIFDWKEGMDLSEVKDYEVIGLAAKFRARLFTVATWKKLMNGRVDLHIVLQVLWRRLWSFVYPQALELARLLHIPFKGDLARELSEATRHGIRLKFVFADNAPGYELLQREGGRAIRRMVRRGQASLDFIGGADHTFTRLDARERLVRVLDERMRAECTHP